MSIESENHIIVQYDVDDDNEIRFHFVSSAHPHYNRCQSIILERTKKNIIIVGVQWSAATWKSTMAKIFILAVQLIETEDISLTYWSPIKRNKLLAFCHISRKFLAFAVLNSVGEMDNDEQPDFEFWVRFNYLSIFQV